MDATGFLDLIRDDLARDAMTLADFDRLTLAGPDQDDRSEEEPLPFNDYDNWKGEA